MGKRFFICSVGTSLLENNNIGSGAVTSIPGNEIEKEEFIKRFNKNGDMNTVPIKDFKSAEIDSLNAYGVKNSDKIVLLSTMTPECYLCALKIKEHYSNNSISCKADLVEELKGAEDKNFEAKGLPSFLNSVVDYVKKGKEEGYDKRILNPTGGYKSLFPLMTIVGILYELEVIYLFQESGNLVKIPPLPLGVDIYEWSRNKVRLESIIGRSTSEVAETWKKLSKKMKTLVKEQDGKYIKTSILDFFLNTVKNIDHRFNPLYLKTKKISFHEFFVSRSDLWDKFSHLVEIGHLIWIGDRVPEMVDHALRHHTNLFEIAERFLLPILDKNDKFLSEEDLFVLLCTIYLHDCGHVIGRIKDKSSDIVPLLPTEIREYHHILGYERLKNWEEDIYQSKILYENLNWGNSDGKSMCAQEVWNNYLELVATIGLFHRKRMPLLNGDDPYKECNFFQDEYMSLGKWNLKFEGKDFSQDRILLLASLFRIIDSMDNQVARTGDEMEIAFHLSQLEVEAKEENDRADKLKELIMEKINDGCRELDDAIQKAIASYRKSESKTSSTTGEMNSQEFRKFLEGFKSKLSLSDEWYNLIWEYVSAKMRADFKDYQKEHYDAHSIVQRIIIQYENKNGNHHFTIDLEINHNLAKKRGRCHEEERKKFLTEMKKEYEYTDDGKKRESVKKILNNNSIYLEYKGV